MAPKELDETIKRILTGCRRDDRRSQKELYRNYYALSMRICLRYANNRDDACSIMNEGFYKVFTNIKAYDFKRPFVAWLSRIMTNTAIDFYRAGLRFSNNNNRIDTEEDEETGITDEPIHAQLNYQDLVAMVQSLTPSYRAVFNLYAIEGYSHEEIAKMLGISVGTSKSNLFRARANLSHMVRRSEMVGNTQEINLEEKMNMEEQARWNEKK